MNTDNTAHRAAVTRPMIATAFILMVPLVAMQVSDQVTWSPFDFAVAGTLVFGTGLLYELATRKAVDLVYRVAVGLALLAAFLLIWINLAVGIIGSEKNPANLMYFGVIAVEVIGALIARSRPRGMAYALFATAFAQALVGAIALVFGMDSWVQILGLNGMFIALFVTSALFFQHAARQQPAIS